MKRLHVQFKLTFKHPKRGPIGYVSPSLKKIVQMHAAAEAEGGRDLDVTAYVEIPE